MAARLLIALMVVSGVGAFSAHSALPSLHGMVQLRSNEAGFAAGRSPILRMHPLLQRRSRSLSTRPVGASALFAAKEPATEVEEQFIDPPGLAPYLNKQGLVDMLKFSASLAAFLYVLKIAFTRIIADLKKQKVKQDKEYKENLEKWRQHGYEIPGYK